MLETFSLHKVDSETDFPFDPTEYSRFKFGSKNASKDFGKALGEAFCKEVLPNLPDPIVIISSPYCFIPTATFAMKDYFLKEVNNWLVENDRPVVNETRIHRTITYKEDYGALSAEDRMKLISGDSFHIDADFVEGKSLILLDDIKITGSRERVVENTIQKFGLEDHHRVYTYFAELTNPDICPTIENFFNYAFVKSIFDVEEIIDGCCDSFMFNTRVVKYLLCSPHEEFIQFINNTSDNFAETLYHLAIGNSYHTVDDYQENLSYVKTLL